MAEIKLTRPAGYRVDRGRKYQVFVDRKKVGSIKIGETKVFTFPPGQHELRLKEDWGASEKLLVDLGDNDQAAFVCAPRVKQNDETIMVGFKLVYWMTLGCRRYIDLRPGEEIPVEVEPKRGLLSLNGPKLFGIALLIGIAYWALAGQGFVVMGVVVAAMAFVAAGLVGRGIGKGAGQISRKAQKRRDG